MKKISLIVVSLAIMTCLAGCNSIPEIKTNDNDNEETNIALPKFAKISNNPEVVDYINNIKYSEADVLAYDLSTTVSGQEGVTDNGSTTALTVTKKTLKDVTNGTGSVENMSAAEGTLYPGQLLLADDKLMTGTPTTMNLDRGNAKFTVNLPGLTDLDFTTEVTYSNVQSKINQKLNDWAADPNHKRTSSFEYSIQQAYSSSQVDVTFGIGIADKLDINGEVNTTSEKKTFILSYKDIYFTSNVSMDDKYNQIFADGVTKDQVEAKINAEGKVTPPLIINTCSYGKIIYFKVETSMSKDEVSAAFSYAGSVSADAKATFTEETKDCNISCYVYGGTNNTASLVQINKANSGEQVAEIFSADANISSSIINYKLISYSTNFIDRNQKSATVISTSKYMETTCYTIHDQEIYIRNEGGFEIKKMWIFGKKIKSYDSETGLPIYNDSYETLYEKGHIAVCNDFTYRAPANYGQIKFKYDITAGQKPAFDGRLSGNDWFEKADIRTCGTTYNNYIKLTVDGVYSQV